MEPSEAVKAFATMASRAMTNGGLGALRWETGGQTRQITQVQLLIDDDMLWVAWGSGTARQEAEVEPKTLRQMVQGHPGSPDERVNWYYVRGGNVVLVSDLVGMRISLGLAD